MLKHCMMFYKDDKRELDEHFPIVLIDFIWSAPLNIMMAISSRFNVLLRCLVVNVSTLLPLR